MQFEKQYLRWLELQKKKEEGLSQEELKELIELTREYFIECHCCKWLFPKEFQFVEVEDRKFCSLRCVRVFRKGLCNRESTFRKVSSPYPERWIEDNCKGVFRKYLSVRGGAPRSKGE